MPRISLGFGKSIKTQLTVLLFGLTALSILVVGFLGLRGVVDSGRKTGQISSSAALQRAEEILVQTATATADENSALFKTIEQKTSTAAESTKNILQNPQKFANGGWRFDTDTKKLPGGSYGNSADELGSVFLASITPPTPAIKKELEVTSYLDYLLPEILKTEPNAVALYYNGASGVSRYYPNIGLAGLVPADFDLKAQEFYFVADPKHDPEKTTKWTSVYDDPAGNGLAITAAHPIYLKKGGFVGSVGLDVTLNTIAKNIEDYSPIESSYAFLIDTDGRAVALPAQGYADILGRKPKKGEFGPDLSKVKGDFASVLKDMRAAKKGFTNATVGGGDLYVAYAPLQGTTFSVGIVAKQGVLLKVVSDLEAQVQKSTSQVLYLQILPFAVLLLALVWILGFFYIRFITGPIIALTNKTNRIMQGSLNQEIDIKASNNEVGKLAEAFNKMIRELAASYKALEHKVVELGSAKAKDDAILNSIGDGVIVIDTEGKILLINEIAADVLGFEAGRDDQHVSDRAILDANGEVLENKDRPMRRAIAIGKKVKQEIVVQYTMGKKIVLDVTATPVIQSDKTIGAIAILHDVTKEKEIDLMKTEFITVASHQLRTPLSGIKWFSGMLIHGDAGKLEPQQYEFVNNIHVSTEHMIQLVNALLNVSSLESGRIMISPVPTDLKELIDNTVKDLKSKSDEKKQEITVEVEEGLPKLNIDPGLIGQVYNNLISNSLKYTPEGGKIFIKVSRKGDLIMSQVKDTGLGIPEEDQKKIFNKFFRGSNILRVDTDGTGLGMYLAKAIVESSNGQIGFDSQENKGSMFWFTLPLEGMKRRDPEAEDITSGN